MELPHIGQTCVICNRTDYLPFKCTHCDKTVCVDHKTNHGFECPLNGSHFEASISGGCPSESLKQACDYCKKITLKLELTECLYCKTFNCLYHRHQVQHSCPKLAESKELFKEEQEKRVERQTAALDKLKANIKQQPSSSSQETISTNQRKQAQQLDPKKRELARRLRVMKIKQFARGPPNIAPEDKIYFEVRFEHEPESPLSQASKHGKSVKMFTTAKHSIGRMLDWSAEELGIVNKNNLSDSFQLVFKKANESCDSELITLEYKKSFSYYLDNKELQNGDEIILTYSLPNS